MIQGRTRCEAHSAGPRTWTRLGQEGAVARFWQERELDAEEETEQVGRDDRRHRQPDQGSQFAGAAAAGVWA